MFSSERAVLRLAACLAAYALSACQSAGPWKGSIEYSLSTGLRAVNAQPAYDAGITGRGVTVALVDCGLDKKRREIGRNLSAMSTDLNPGRKVELPDRHGDEVAGPLASMLDGHGLA